MLRELGLGTLQVYEALASGGWDERGETELTVVFTDLVGFSDWALDVGDTAATELIRQVLDDVRAQGKTVTIMCPIVRSFIDRNTEYAELVDAAHPGVTRR
jgi:hypothetical protein